MQCPKCDSQYVVKNGHTHTGKQNFKCRDKGRKIVRNSRHQPISKSTRQLGAVKREVQVTSKKKGKLIIQCDEMWSFVGFKGNKQWMWLAIDVLTKEIVGVYIGKRDETPARGLWDSIPAISRQCAVSYTDLCPFLRNSFS
jgi:transposase-like protein